MASTHVFPQTGDNDDAENFAQLIGQTNLQDYVEQGMGLTADYTNLSVSIGTGLAYIGVGSQTASSTSETRLSTTMAVQISSATKSLTDAAVNHIYVEPDIATNDSAYYAVYTNTGNASANALKIGEVDTSANTTTEVNREPNLTANSASVSGLVDVGGDIQTSSGTVIWDSSNGYIPQSSVQQGSGSGLDADQLDGKDSSAFVLDSGDSMNGQLSMGANDVYFQPGTAGGSVTAVTFESNTNAGSDFGYIEYHDDYFSGTNSEQSALLLRVENDSNNPDAVVLDGVGGTYVERGDLDVSNAAIIRGYLDVNGTGTLNQANVNGTSGSASSHGSTGIGAPTVYTSMVEASTEKGTASTYIELGSGGYHSSVGADEIAFVTGGTVSGLVDANANLKIEGTFTENTSL